VNDAAREARVLAEEVGLVALAGRTLLRVRGADAADYLQRMLTQDVAAVTPGRGAAACFLTPEGRILAHLLLWHPPGEALLLDLAPGAAAAATPALERYVIADDVVFEDESASHARAVMLGPRLAPALERLGLSAPSAGELARGTLDGVAVTLLGRSFGSRPSAEVLLPAAGAERALAALATVAPAVGLAALEIARVEECVPAYGSELDSRVLPNEAALTDAVSFTKGCYPGQEPVIMAHHRGHPAQRLVRLSISGAAVPAPGAALSKDGRPIGRITTAVLGRDGRPAALGYVRWALAQPGAVLHLQVGATAAILSQ
jgi:hypothetical protein